MCACREERKFSKRDNVPRVKTKNREIHIDKGDIINTYMNKKEGEQVEQN